MGSHICGAQDGCDRQTCDKAWRDWAMLSYINTCTTLDLPTEPQEPEQREAGVDFEGLRESVRVWNERAVFGMTFEERNAADVVMQAGSRLIDLAERCEGAEAERDRLEAEIEYQKNMVSKRWCEREQARAECNQLKAERDEAREKCARLQAELAALRSGTAGLSETERAAVEHAQKASTHRWALFVDDYRLLLDIITRLSAIQPALPWRDGAKETPVSKWVVWVHKSSNTCYGLFAPSKESQWNDYYWIYIDALLPTLPKE